MEGTVLELDLATHWAMAGSESTLYTAVFDFVSFPRSCSPIHSSGVVGYVVLKVFLSTVGIIRCAFIIFLQWPPS